MTAQMLEGACVTNLHLRLRALKATAGRPYIKVARNDNKNSKSPPDNHRQGGFFVAFVFSALCLSSFVH